MSLHPFVFMVILFLNRRCVSAQSLYDPSDRAPCVVRGNRSLYCDAPDYCLSDRNYQGSRSDGAGDSVEYLEIGPIERVTKEADSEKKMVLTTSEKPHFIVGGDPIEITKMPSYVVINVYSHVGLYKCGGNLVSKSHVLTAGHCVTTTLADVDKGEEFTVFKPEYFTLRIGSTFSDAGGKEVKARKIQTHPDYLKNSVVEGYRDLAVITLAEEVQLDSSANFAALHPAMDGSAFDTIVGTKCTVAGWGRTEAITTKSNRLLQIAVTIISTDNCKSYYMERMDPEVHLCALEKGKSGCHGDSGGGLFCDNKIVGVVSWGESCIGTKPVVYARVDNALTFIRGVIDNQTMNKKPPKKTN